MEAAIAKYNEEMLKKYLEEHPEMDQDLEKYGNDGFASMDSARGGGSGS